ncbi:DUF2515 family protein [Brevibacillus choshinensis]|nr:DUF2515 family protein [Brevibacillus choshinensis]
MGFSWMFDPPLLSLAKEIKQAIAREKEMPEGVSLPAKEQKIVEHIKEQTFLRNQDNVERTRAYVEYYQKHTEIHWALLAHLVSRNAGWSMTDLRGELLPKLLSPKEQNDYFLFLERGNWLIFQDAYPQLLLYEECVRQKTNLFHLLPHFHVSVFTQALWNQFWREGDRDLLAVGLIINEQQHLEEQVMKEESYQKTVLGTLPFAIQELLALNQILFPCAGDGQPLRLVGETVSHFASVTERISLGKRLYALLFRDDFLLQAVFGWARGQAHTGSRKDFWPHLFHDVKESVPGKPYQRRVGDCLLVPGAKRLYSPTLRQAWKQVKHEMPAEREWYRDRSVLSYLRIPKEKAPAPVNRGEAYCRTLEKIELAVLARGKIFGAKEP